MARTSILTGGSNSAQTTSEDLNGYATDFLSDGIVGATANTSGVAPSTGGLAVNAQGSPNTTTAITAGTAWVTATPTSQGSQRLRVKIDAQNYTHSANSSGSTRYDWIYVAVSASLAANPIADMSTTGTIFVSRSTSSSTDNGTPPTYGYCIAVVTLANGFASVTNGNIADKRVQTGPTIAGTLAATAWSSWTPNWTNLTIGNAAVTAHYQQIGKTVHGRVSVVFGSTSSLTGDVTFTLPVTAVTPFASGGVMQLPIGPAQVYDSSAVALFSAGCYQASTTTGAIRPFDASGTYLKFSLLSSTVPFGAAFAVGDEIGFSFVYEAA